MAHAIIAAVAVAVGLAAGLFYLLNTEINSTHNSNYNNTHNTYNYTYNDFSSSSTSDRIDHPNSTRKRRKEKDKKCVICLDEFTPVKCLEELLCGHTFHKNCINQWKVQNQTCPTCRQRIL